MALLDEVVAGSWLIVLLLIRLSIAVSVVFGFVACFWIIFYKKFLHKNRWIRVALGIEEGSNDPGQRESKARPSRPHPKTGSFRERR
jgi:hypothetical protein